MSVRTSSAAKEDSLRRDVVRVAVPAFIALIVLAAASFVLAQRVATSEALRDDTQLAQIVARSSVAPLLEGTDIRTASGTAAMDALAQDRLLVAPVVAVRLWSTDGTIVYATDHRLIGKTFALDDEEQDVLRDGGSFADVSDLTKPENQYESGFGELVEVYTPVSDGRGHTYLFEMYTLQSSISASAERIMGAFLPVVLGSLVVLTLVLIAVSWLMVRRLRRAAQARELLLQRALDASELERRRIAADLHDGVVQDLAGVTYSLAALATQSSDASMADQLSRASQTTQQAVRGLRSLLVDIYPPSLREAGIAAAITDLLAALPAGIERAFQTPDAPLQLDDDVQAAAYRVARETLHNVARHAHATAVTVVLQPTDAGGVLLVVQDDGVGFTPGQVPQGHLGLSLLAELAASVDGHLEVTSAPQSGTTVRFEVGA